MSSFRKVSKVEEEEANKFRKKPRSSRVGLKPLVSPASDSWWILCNPTNYFDEKVYRVVIVTDTKRQYGRAGHQEAFVRFKPVCDYAKEYSGYTYSLSYDEFMGLFRELKGDELDDERAMILLANVG